MRYVKLSVNASFDHDLLKGTFGAVLRNDKRNFIAGGFWKIDHCVDVLTTESWALRFGLSLAQRAGCNRLVINSDNLEVIETMNNGGWSAGAATTIFDDCYFWLVIFLPPCLNTVIGKPIKSCTSLLGWLRLFCVVDWFEEPMIEIVPFLTNK